MHLQVARALQQRDHRVEVADRVDLAAAHRRHRALPAPTPMMDTSLGFSPALARKKLTITLVDEPGAVTPIFLPFRSARSCSRPSSCGFTPSTICGAGPAARRRAALALVLHVDGVLEGAGDDVGTAAHHRLQRREPPAKSTMVTSRPSALK
jgi:hypothetical protein